MKCTVLLQNVHGVYFYNLTVSICLLFEYLFFIFNRMSIFLNKHFLNKQIAHKMSSVCILGLSQGSEEVVKGFIKSANVFMIFSQLGAQGVCVRVCVCVNRTFIQSFTHSNNLQCVVISITPPTQPLTNHTVCEKCITTKEMRFLLKPCLLPNEISHFLSKGYIFKWILTL